MSRPITLLFLLILSGPSVRTHAGTPTKSHATSPTRGSFFSFSKLATCILPLAALAVIIWWKMHKKQQERTVTTIPLPVQTSTQNADHANQNDPQPHQDSLSSPTASPPLTANNSSNPPRKSAKKKRRKRKYENQLRNKIRITENFGPEKEYPNNPPDNDGPLVYDIEPSRPVSSPPKQAPQKRMVSPHMKALMEKFGERQPQYTYDRDHARESVSSNPTTKSTSENT